MPSLLTGAVCWAGRPKRPALFSSRLRYSLLGRGGRPKISVEASGSPAASLFPAAGKVLQDRENRRLGGSGERGPGRGDADHVGVGDICGDSRRNRYTVAWVRSLSGILGIARLSRKHAPDAAATDARPTTPNL